MLQIARAFQRSDSQSVHDALADLIVLEGLPMRVVKSKYLRKFIDSLCRSVENNVLAAWGVKVDPKK